MPADSIGAELRGAAAALAFLSRLPFGASGSAAADVARGAWAFPLAGALIGAAVGATALAAEEVFTVLVAAALGTLAAVLITGALHLDGLADSADGLGGRSREQALQAMRDHAVGAYGSAAIVLDLLLRASLLAALLDRPGFVASLLVAGAVSRAAVLPLPLSLPYAQPVPGHGAALSGGGGVARAVLAIAIATGISFTLLGDEAIAVLAVAAAVAASVGLLARRRFGGVTGDVLGATVELVELAALATLVAQA